MREVIKVEATDVQALIDSITEPMRLRLVQMMKDQGIIPYWCTCEWKDSRLHTCDECLKDYPDGFQIPPQK